jgi:hypothetical protein
MDNPSSAAPLDETADSRLALFEIAIEMFGWRLGNGSCVVL